MNLVRHPAILAVLLLAALAGCAIDRRKEVAFDILFSEDGLPRAEAISQALSARFPPGSPVQAMSAFVERAGGSCRERESGHLWCELVTRSEFCASSILGIDIAFQSGAIGYIKVRSGGLGC